MSVVDMMYCILSTRPMHKTVCTGESSTKDNLLRNLKTFTSMAVRTFETSSGKQEIFLQ